MPAKILIVDDQQFLRRTLRSLLAQQPHWNVYEAENGEVALERIRKIQPDVVMLDLVMPEMNGIELAYEIRRLEGAPKIVLISSHYTPEEAAARSTKRSLVTRDRFGEGCTIASRQAVPHFRPERGGTVWRNKESKSAAPSTAPGRVVEPSNAPTSAATHATSWLSPTMRVKGEISGNEDLLVDGKVEGSISVGEHRLTVGHNGHVTGGLAAREIIIHGKVDGNHNIVSESIEIKKDASMIGDVTTRRIVIEDGAGFKGSIEIGESDKQVDSNLDHPIARTLSTSA